MQVVEELGRFLKNLVLDSHDVDPERTVELHTQLSAPLQCPQEQGLLTYMLVMPRNL